MTKNPDAIGRLGFTDMRASARTSATGKRRTSLSFFFLLLAACVGAPVSGQSHLRRAVQQAALAIVASVLLLPSSFVSAQDSIPAIADSRQIGGFLSTLRPLRIFPSGGAVVSIA